MTDADRLIVGLDTPDVGSAHRVVDRIGDAASFYKVGLGLIYAGGLDLARSLIAAGKRVFLDAKLYDIPQTVENAARAAAAFGADFLTVHGDPKVMAAAVRGRGAASTRLLAITLLTSMDGDDLAELGFAGGPQDYVAMRAGQAMEAGCDGVVASGREAPRLRGIMGPEAIIVTPGIRLADAPSDDQRRITTPGDAVAGGADHLVVARPIIAAGDPRAAALRFRDEIAAALGTARDGAGPAKSGL